MKTLNKGVMAIIYIVGVFILGQLTIFISDPLFLELHNLAARVVKLSPFLDLGVAIIVGAVLQRTTIKLIELTNPKRQD